MNLMQYLPLLFVSEGERVIVRELKGKKEIKEKCINQNIIPGKEIKVISNGSSSPCVLSVNDSRVMITEGISKSILVEIVKESH